MSLVIRRKGNKNFFHYFSIGGTAFEYSASDLTIIIDNNKAKLRSLTGRPIALKDGYTVNQITIFDDSTGGGAETFATFILLTQRLIDLGYPAYYQDGQIILGDLISGDANNALVLGSDGKLYVTVSSSGGVQSVTGDIVNNTDPLNPVVLNAFRGKYNANTNTPTLANTDTNQIGRFYEVTEAGTQDFGAGNITFAVGDFVYNDGTVWKKFIDNNQNAQQVAVAIENLTMTGTVNLDLATFDSFEGLLTGNTEITVTNTPASGETFVRNLRISGLLGTETLTLPVGWTIYGEYKVDVINKLTVEFANFTTGGLKVDCFINQPT